MECGLCWREREDEPAMTCIDRGKPENIAEECTIRFCVFAVDDDVRANDHLVSLLTNHQNSSATKHPIYRMFAMNGMSGYLSRWTCGLPVALVTAAFAVGYGCQHLIRSSEGAAVAVAE